MNPSPGLIRTHLIPAARRFPEDGQGGATRKDAQDLRNGELWRFSRLRQCKFLNNIVEQDHRRVKRLVRPGPGFGSFHMARRTLAGREAMAMNRKAQVRDTGGRNMRVQASSIAELFQAAA